MTAPKVIVTLPVYNVGPFVAECIDSLLAQDYPNFEIIAVDDGSTDDSAAIIAARNDPRIRLVRRSVNLGLAATANEALALAAADPDAVYIARMDPDDLCMPDRLSLQVDMLEKNPAAGVCSPGCEYFGTRSGLFLPLETHEEIRSELAFSSAILGSAVMFRAADVRRLDIRYPDYDCAQDYALWVRLIDQLEFIGLRQVVYRYRWHGAQKSTAKRDKQLATIREVSRSFIQSSLGVAMPPAWVDKFDVTLPAGEIRTVGDALLALDAVSHLEAAIAPSTTFGRAFHQACRGRRLALARRGGHMPMLCAYVLRPSSHSLRAMPHWAVQVAKRLLAAAGLTNSRIAAMRQRLARGA